MNASQRRSARFAASLVTLGGIIGTAVHLAGWVDLGSSSGAAPTAIVVGVTTLIILRPRRQ